MCSTWMIQLTAEFTQRIALTNGLREREQASGGGRVERRAVLGYLERLDVLDLASVLDAVGLHDAIAVTVGQRADAALHVLLQPRAPRRVAGRYLFGITAVVRQPF